MDNQEQPEEINELLALDNMFNLPEGITDDANLQHMYTVWCIRMQREVAHLPVLTLHYMLIDQIAFNYVFMREQQRRGRWQMNPATKAFGQYWMSQIQEFNKLVVQSTQSNQKHIIEEITGVILTVISTVKDEKERNALKARIATALDEAGLV